MYKASIFFLFFALTANAQIDSYDLSTYIQPDVKNFFSFINPQYSNSNTLSIYGGSEEYESSFGFYFDGAIINTINKANSNSRLQYNGDLSFFRIKNDFDRRIGFGSYQTVNYLRNNYNAKNRFFSFGVASNARYNVNNTFFINPADEERKFRSITTLVIPQVSIGTGRVQNIGDAWLATSILKVLRANNVLNKNVTHSEITALGDVLSNLRNVRAQSSFFYDRRNLRNRQFEILSNHLIDSYLVESDNPFLYAILYDAWQFENFVERFSNNEFRIGIEADAFFTFQNSFWRDGNEQSTQIGPIIFAQYVINKPLSLKWQLTGTNRVEAAKSFKMYPQQYEEIDYYEGELSRIALTSDWRIDFLQNLRTNYFATLEGELTSFKSTIDTPNEYTSSHLGVNFGIGFSHYFSPVLIMNSSLYAVGDLTQNDIYSGSLRTGVNFSVTYFVR